ncbi:MULTISPECIES: hypothetical protein [unclassified Rhizobium]|nr:MULTISPECIES: hypothetical protein [unclassified Rhizobium]MDM9622980.1 hypothetical protein [Rhizobium sp. S96]
MDFIEQWFGISPDGGDGTIELLFFAIVMVLLTVVVWRRWIARRYSRKF